MVTTVNYEVLNSANVLVSNKVDDNKMFDINANVNVQNGSIQSFENGNIANDTQVKANFRRYSGNLTIDFFCAADEIISVVSAINAFIEASTELVENKPIEL